MGQIGRHAPSLHRKEAAEKKKRAEQVWAEHQAVLDSIEAERLNPTPSSVRNPPRVRSL